MQHVATYLNDHLAGSMVAIELLEHLQKTHAGTAVASFAAQLQDEIVADRQELGKLMARLGIAESLPRKVGGWVAEKMAELKLRLDAPADSDLRLLEVFEAVSVGIEGKRLLWRSLAVASETHAQLAAADYGALQQRAEEQRRRVEPVRLEAARAALAI